MPLMLTPNPIAFTRNANEPSDLQLADCFYAHIPADIEKHIIQLNIDYPLMTLHARIGQGQITKGQWILYVAYCLTSNIRDIELTDFVEKCPGLILDVELLFKEMGMDEFRKEYAIEAKPYLLLVLAFQEEFGAASHIDELHTFYDEVYMVCDKPSMAPAQYSPDGRIIDLDLDLDAWLEPVETWVLGYVSENPAQFFI